MLFTVLLYPSPARASALCGGEEGTNIRLGRVLILQSLPELSILTVDDISKEGGKMEQIVSE